jgi:hypothetical protein
MCWHQEAGCAAPPTRSSCVGGASGWQQGKLGCRFRSPTPATCAQPRGLTRCTSARWDPALPCAATMSSFVHSCAATGAHAVRHARERAASMDRVARHIVSRCAQRPDERLPREKGRRAPFLLAGVQGQRPAGGVGGRAPTGGVGGRAPTGVQGQRPARYQTLPHAHTGRSIHRSRPDRATPGSYLRPGARPDAALPSGVIPLRNLKRSLSVDRTRVVFSPVMAL